jgi:chemotaxis protein CheY-P-specific phosphatase CheC
METLNKKESEVAMSIINIGLDKAAESLSFFMKEEIQLESLDLSVNKVNTKFDFTNKLGDNIHFLITDVIGELKGVCCLIFSEKEADQLRKIALPKEILENPLMMNEMADAIMLEADNIISASVITQFSNILNHRIYGGVPQLKKFSSKQLNDFVESNYGDDLFIINFKVHFSSSHMDFKPQFVWLFDNSFLLSIKKFAEAEENMEKLVLQ